jgi:RND family efflux transporter MFP subunit
VEEAAYRHYRTNALLVAANGGTLPCELGLDSEQGCPHRGRLDFFDNQVNPQTGTIRLRAVFENRDRALVPGMFANVRVLAGPPGQALLIPDVAVQSDQGYKFVYVANAEGKVETRYIQTGPAHGPLREVLKGLTPEERVIVNGLLMLRPGLKVAVEVAKAEGEDSKSEVRSPKSELEGKKAAAGGEAKTEAKPQT